MGLASGGHLLGAFIVARSADEFVIYLRCNWIRFREFRIVRTYRGYSGDRAFKNLHSAWSFVGKFGFTGEITIYPAGHADLRQFSGLSAQDFEDSDLSIPAPLRTAPADLGLAAEHDAPGD